MIRIKKIYSTGVLILFVSLLMIYLFSGNNLLFDTEIDFNTQVKPILNKNCVSCHGGVKQNGGFLLMSRSTALAINESGIPAIYPGNADRSELIRRLLHTDPDERMPQDAPPLSKEEIKILTRWIDQGAKWGLHWAYHPIQKDKFEIGIKLGSFSNGASISSTQQVDKLVIDQVKQLGMTANDPATNPELLRRISMDIIGMPAPISLQQLFLNEKISYSSLVDSLLSQNSFGEKWASMWLDIARYADSKGYEKDQNRTIWPYRDYVIKAFNSDKPFNEFIIEQLAGDLLENPTEDQYIATGFHRNTTTNDEGGTNNEEYRIKAVMDRVATTWEGIMGTTMACVQCHGHPYDPFTHEEYYQSFAYLNNTRDADTHLDYPLFQLLNPERQSELDSLKKWIENNSHKDKADEIALFIKTGQPVIYSIETDQLDNAAFYDTKYLGLRENGSARIPQVALSNKSSLLMRAVSYLQEGTLSLHLDKIDGPLLGELKVSNVGRQYDFVEIPLLMTEGLHDIYLQYKNPGSSNRDAHGLLIDWFYFMEEFPGEGNPGQFYYKEKFKELLEVQQPTTLIMTENPDDRRRKTHVFDRGNWLTPTKEVDPGIPLVLKQSNDKIPKDRLAFTKWIASKENPLTARTFVNRIWEQLFGMGIVATTEDLGSQGEPPSNQPLLDFLAYEWMYNQDWKIKDLIKMIVLSKTYCQSAKASYESLQKDPNNKYLSRGPRVRLSAEQLRDQALSISGLLSKKMYGPPVMPHQPGGIWNTPYNAQKWVTSEGEDKYRRGVYTMIKRSSIYPSMETFDAPQRLVCASRRVRTNTPLQALVTLNDPVFVEAAEHLAKRMQNEGGEKLHEQIEYAYRLAMSKPISEEKSDILEQLFQQTLSELKSDNPEDEQKPKIKALSIVANALLNLDEFLNN